MRMNKFICGVLAALAISTPAQAVVLGIDAGWSDFFFDLPGTPIEDFKTGDLDFTFTLAGDGVLRLTDAFLVGDMFRLTINGVLQAPSSTPGTGANVGGDFDAAYASGYYSVADYALPAGSYTVTGEVFAAPFGGAGTGALRVDSVSAGAVPEPETWAMMLAGMFFTGARLRRRLRTKVRFAL